MKTACIQTYLYFVPLDRIQTSEVAAAHAGWRGLADGMLERSVAAMRTPPQHVMAWLGPAAGPQVYEIGQDVFDAFVAHDAQAQSAFVATRPGHWLVDLYALARQRLQQAGVAPRSPAPLDKCWR
ncbi:laccase domain-containing protein [Dickeya chrysanthemi]|uniref:laccase domain-containing protein n=1 Tax=Dickeya chrysanthemi TaxID=556 RepID=UPI0025A0382A|nr:laccase domain-containing protein [Dickeya chrysanthemi]WJM85497.1 laccase domain-containing protein [Dickeya chrysanthemi]